jgi:hypothetical protein
VDGNPKAEKPSRMRLPGFINDADIGLGDAVSRVTRAVTGRPPCQGCARRAALLNQWLTFVGRNTPSGNRE